MGPDGGRDCGIVINAPMVVALPVLAVSCSSTLPAGTEPAAKTAGMERTASCKVHCSALGKAQGAWSQNDQERREQPLEQVFKALLDADIITSLEI